MSSAAIEQMRPGVMVVNTGRGALVFARLLTFPNVLITAHQAFLTTDALEAIARTTLANLDRLATGLPCNNLVV